MQLHLISDVEVGAYVSGGIDSSLVARMAERQISTPLRAFHGKYGAYTGFDESSWAKLAVESSSLELKVADFTAEESWQAFLSSSYFLDYPSAGPGSIPQFLISKVASQDVKVVLGGQGGDEIFGGYARYLIAYLEQTLKAGIEGTAKTGKFVVTLGSIIPNLEVLREYVPLIQKAWSSNLFGDIDERYLQLVSKAGDLESAINWDALDLNSTHSAALAIFNDRRSVRKEALFDSMTHFDLKTLLPALLQVEDRMSMASGLESRVPLLDHKLVEFAASVPADIKFKDGQLKRLLKIAGGGLLPNEILNRRDKMGFPVPLAAWTRREWGPNVRGLLESLRDRDLDFLNGHHFESLLATQVEFSRGLWALISLEMWMQNFHDSHSPIK